MLVKELGKTFDPNTHPREGTRVRFGDALLELGAKNPDVVALAADCGIWTGAAEFGKRFPGRAFNVGIAEQNLVGVAAGLASAGLIPFATSYSPFVSTRGLEQIKVDMAYTKFNVKIAAIAGGIAMGTAGSTHHGNEDLTLLRSIPNMTVLVPADGREAYKATMAAAELVGPVYIRLGRDPEFVLYTEDYDYRIGKAVELRPGNDATIIATGMLVMHAVVTSDILKEEGIGVRVLNMHTIKPLDREAIVKAARETGRIVTAEEHTVMGGLGGAVAEVVVQECPVPMRMVGIQDIFASIGPTYKLYQKYGLTYEGLVSTVRQFVRA